MAIIENGVGNANKAKVDSNNRLHVQASVAQDSEIATFKGDAFNINTGDITLTAATPSSILYFKNNEVVNFVIEAIAVGVGDVTGTEAIKLTMMGGVTGASFSTAVDMNANRLVGSSSVLLCDVYKGAEAATLTGGSAMAQFYMGQGTSRLYATLGIQVAPGQAIGLNIDVNDASGAIVYAAIVGHRVDAGDA
jgi:hypothetical protein